MDTNTSDSYFYKLSELVKRVQLGDKKAFAKLYEATWKHVYNLLLGKNIGEEDAKELLQEIYIKVYSSIKTLDNPIAFMAWLNKITYNHYISFLRKNGFEAHEILDVDISELSDSQLFDDGEFLPENILEKRELWSQIYGIVKELPDKQRLVIFMHYYDDLTPKEIAMAMSTSENTVYKRLYDAKKTIRAKILELDKKGVQLRSVSGPFILSGIIKHVSQAKINPTIGTEIFKCLSETVIPFSLNIAIAKGAIAAGIFIVVGTAFIAPELGETKNMQIATNDEPSSQTKENNITMQNKPQDSHISTEPSTEPSTEGVNPVYNGEMSKIENSSNEVLLLLENIKLTYNLGEVVSVQHFLEDVSKETGNAFSPNQLIALGYNDYIPIDFVGEYYISVTYDDKNTLYESDVKIEILDIEPPQILIDAKDNTLEIKVGNNITHEQTLALAGVTAKDNSNYVELFDNGYENIDFNKLGEYPVYLNGVDLSGNKAEQRVLIVRVQNN